MMGARTPQGFAAALADRAQHIVRRRLGKAAVTAVEAKTAEVPA
jgi:hypothetical protein